MLFLALSPTHVYHSRVVTPDAFVTFFALATFLMTVYLFQEGKIWQYVAAGVAVGLTAASKYNGVLIAISIPAAHFLRTGWSGWRDYRLYLAAALSGLAFLATTPYALLDNQAFMAGMLAEAQHYSTGHVGMQGEPVRWYLAFLWSSVGLPAVLAPVQIVRGMALRSRPIILLSVFPITYFLFITRFVVRNDRTLLPLLPFLFLLAAWLLVDAAELRRRLTSPMARRAVGVVWGLVLVFSLITPIRQDIAFVRQLNAPQAREMAAAWFADNAPVGSRVALESYSPYIDPSRYDVLAFSQMIDNPPQWFVDEGYDYLIFSNGLYGRYFITPEQYSDEVARYNAFFDHFQLAQRFQSGRVEIRVYRVTP
jgi:4-amino-4-deoxy-L-arabinose transferase-like glycosyltransferase